MNCRRISAVARREWREIHRDGLFLALAFILPVMMMLVFTYGLSMDVENLPIAILDYDRSELSREYAHLYIDSRYFDFRGYLHSTEEIKPLLTDGLIRAVIVIQEHFQRDLVEGRPAQIQELLDGTFPSRARTVKGYMTAINRRFERGLLLDHFARHSGESRHRILEKMAPIRFEVRYLYNQGVRSSWALPPKLLVLVLLVAPPFLTVAGVVREKESGSIFNFFASDATRGEYLTGKMLPYGIISVLNSLILWAIAVWLVGAPFRGSPALFFFGTVLYVLCTTAIGLVISVCVRTQMAGVLITAILTIVGSILYSGVLTPVTSLSSDNQTVAHLFPAMYYTNIVDGVFLKGVGLDILWVDMLVLAVYAAALFTLGYSRFKKRPRT